jgi:hypothetical protein
MLHQGCRPGCWACAARCLPFGLVLARGGSGGRLLSIRWRGPCGYPTGYLSEDDDDTIPLCRIQYLGDPDQPAFAIWQASTGS